MSRAASAKLFPPTCSQDNAKPDATVQSDFRRTCSEEAFFLISVFSGRFLQRSFHKFVRFQYVNLERSLKGRYKFDILFLWKRGLQFDATLSWTVADVKAKVFEFGGIRPQQQRLVLPEVLLFFGDIGWHLVIWRCDDGVGPVWVSRESWSGINLMLNWVGLTSFTLLATELSASYVYRRSCCL